MRVKCKSIVPNEEQAKSLGIGVHYYPDLMEFDLIIDEEYLVFAISFLGGKPWIQIYGQSIQNIHTVPLCLFEIIEGSVSNCWTAKVDNEENFFLWPLSFYRPYYHDDLSNGVLEIVEDFKQVEKYLFDEDQNRKKLRITNIE